MTWIWGILCNKEARTQSRQKQNSEVMILTPEATITCRVDKGTFPSSSLPSNFVVPSDAGFGDTFDQRGGSELGSKKLSSTLCFCFLTGLCSSSGMQSYMSPEMSL